MEKNGGLTRIGRWARAATEWRAATAESAESEPWPSPDAPGRKDCGDGGVAAVVAVVRPAGDGDDVVVVAAGAVVVERSSVRSNRHRPLYPAESTSLESIHSLRQLFKTKNKQINKKTKINPNTLFN